MDMLAWYSLDTNDKPSEHEPVALPAALEIAKKNFDEAGRSDITMFGFTRGEDTFIQFSVCGPQSILFWFETPKDPNAKKGFFGKIFPSVLSHEKTLTTWPEMEKTITDFYSNGPKQFYENLKRAA